MAAATACRLLSRSRNDPNVVVTAASFAFIGPATIGALAAGASAICRARATTAAGSDSSVDE